MNDSYLAAIECARKIAEERNIPWNVSLSGDGKIFDKDVWCLTDIVKSVSPSKHYLNNLGPDPKSWMVWNDIHGTNAAPSPLNQYWQDLIKAAVIDQLLVRRNSTGHIVSQIVRPLKIVAMCADEAPPWSLTVDHIRTAMEVADKVQPAGKLKDVVAGIVKTIIDGWLISESGPLFPQINASRLKMPSSRAKFAKREKELLSDLQERKRAERLPDRRAFWELVRIVFCESPRNYTDEIRFAAIKVLLLCGLRIGEVSMLPKDWKRTRSYVDRNGRAAGEAGGFSTSMQLRHFAEKQQSDELDSEVLYPSTQPIPKNFEAILESTLDRVAELTEPLRQTLKQQVESGKLLPWFEQDALVPLVRLYPYMTGQPFWLKMDKEDQDSFIRRYKINYDASVLQELAEYQDSRYWNGTGMLDNSTYVQLHRLKESIESGRTDLRLYKMNGTPYDGTHIKSTPWQFLGVKISDFEEYLSAKAATKMPDVTPYRLGNGDLVQTWELLFLIPKRALSEARNDGICDVTRHYAVGVMGSDTVALALKASNPDSLFARYGETQEDRELSLNPHSLRHLQNSELFRMGISDAVISKRFNRKSVVQSYEYDHRSLAEQLDEIELPEDVEIALGPKSSNVFKMIKSGKASGPIVDKFKKIQSTQGDAAAFQFLRTEADGFHATPYGHCLNSFTVDPCPKHLECFAGCNHLSATGLDANKRNLIQLEGKLKETIESIRQRKGAGIGLTNQLAHAEVRLEGVQKLLATPAGERVFPDGVDLSIPSPSTVQDL